MGEIKLELPRIYLDGLLGFALLTSSIGITSCASLSWTYASHSFRMSASCGASPQQAVQDLPRSSSSLVLKVASQIGLPPAKNIARKVCLAQSENDPKQVTQDNT